MFAKLHLLSQDVPEGGNGLRWRAHPYLRIVGSVPKGPAVFSWSDQQHKDLDALWQDPSADGARERLAKDLAAFCNKLGWKPDATELEDAAAHGDEFLLTLSAVPPELYLLPWEVIEVGAGGKYLSDYASAQVRYVVPGLEPRAIQGAPPVPGVLFAWSAAGGAVPHDEQAVAIREAAEVGGAVFRELADVDEASLQAALDAGPPSVVHFLCHGLSGSHGEPSRLAWGTSDRRSEITAPRLAQMLRPHQDAIRLVVLSACGSGDGFSDPLLMGSLAQELHKNGIATVVASRYPLSVAGSRVMTRALYDKLLREAWSLERALRHTREALFRADDSASHPGDAYGIQLYAYDTEKFISDNDVEAERPVLASYPFGTAARPVPAKAPPAAELALHLDDEPKLSADELIEKLRKLSEDAGLTVEIRPAQDGKPMSRIVRTTIDGAQRLLSARRSKLLHVALGVVIGKFFLFGGVRSAFADTLPSPGHAGGQAASGNAGTGASGQAGSAGGNAAASGQAGQAGGAVGKAGAAGAGKGGAAATAKAVTTIAGKVVTAKLAVAAVIGSAALVTGGVAVYRSQTQPALAVAAAQAAPAPSASVASNESAQTTPGSTTATAPNEPMPQVPASSAGPAAPSASAVASNEPARQAPGSTTAAPPTEPARQVPASPTGVPPAGSASTSSTGAPAAPGSTAMPAAGFTQPVAHTTAESASKNSGSHGAGASTNRDGQSHTASAGRDSSSRSASTASDEHSGAAPQAASAIAAPPPASSPAATTSPSAAPRIPTIIGVATWASAAQPAPPASVPAQPVAAEDLSTELLPPSQLTPPTMQSLRLSGNTQPQPSETDVNRMLSRGVDHVRGIVELCISARGGVMDVKLAASTGYPDYDKTLLAAVQTWRYRPFSINSLPVPACSTVEFIYNVGD